MVITKDGEVLTLDGFIEDTEAEVWRLAHAECMGLGVIDETVDDDLYEEVVGLERPGPDEIDGGVCHHCGEKVRTDVIVRLNPDAAAEYIEQFNAQVGDIGPTV